MSKNNKDSRSCEEIGLAELLSNATKPDPTDAEAPGEFEITHLEVASATPLTPTPPPAPADVVVETPKEKIPEDKKAPVAQAIVPA